MIIVIVITGIAMKSIIGYNYICKSTSKFAKCVTLPMKLIFKCSSLIVIDVMLALDIHNFL